MTDAAKAAEERTSRDKVRKEWPNAYVDWFITTHEYVIWSTDDPSEKILGRGAKKYAAWDDAASRLTAVAEPATNEICAHQGDHCALSGNHEGPCTGIAAEIEEPAKVTERPEIAIARECGITQEQADNFMGSLLIHGFSLEPASPGDVREGVELPKLPENDGSYSPFQYAWQCVSYREKELLAALQQVAELKPKNERLTDANESLALRAGQEQAFKIIAEAELFRLRGEITHLTERRDDWKQLAHDYGERFRDLKAENADLRGEFVDQLKRDDQTYETIKKIRDGELKEREK